jgi:hypothetical protein
LNKAHRLKSDVKAVVKLRNGGVKSQGINIFNLIVEGLYNKLTLRAIENPKGVTFI